MSLFLSIIIPAYNEETRLPGTLEEIFSFLNSKIFTFEVLVVENGSTDKTLQIATSLVEIYPELIVLHEDVPGKGNAVRRGMLEARGKYRFLCDADLSMPISEIEKFLPDDKSIIDVAIGSREVKGAQRYDEPWHRHLTGRIFNLFVNTITLPRIKDTQCGFKCFRGDVAEHIFKQQTLDGWAFDVEILAIARSCGYEIKEIPISWYYESDSKVNLWSDALKMFSNILIIRKNLVLGFYDDTQRGAN